MSQRLQGALQNTVEVAFRLGRGDAEWAAPRFGHFDPYAVKHEVVDPHQVDRTHPVYFSLQETLERWTELLETLHPREALVNIGKKTTTIGTLTVPPPTCSQESITALMDRYAARLLTKRDIVAAAVDQTPVHMPEQTVFRRVPVGVDGTRRR